MLHGSIKKSSYRFENNILLLSGIDRFIDYKAEIVKTNDPDLYESYLTDHLSLVAHVTPCPLPKVLLRLGKHHGRAGNYNEAARCFRDVIETFTNPQCFVEPAELKAVQDLYDKSIEWSQTPDQKHGEHVTPQKAWARIAIPLFALLIVVTLVTRQPNSISSLRNLQVPVSSGASPISWPAELRLSDRSEPYATKAPHGRYLLHLTKKQKEAIANFLNAHPDLTFTLTPIGRGLGNNYVQLNIGTMMTSGEMQYPMAGWGDLNGDGVEDFVLIFADKLPSTLPPLNLPPFIPNTKMPAASAGSDTRSGLASKFTFPSAARLLNWWLDLYL